MKDHWFDYFCRKNALTADTSYLLGPLHVLSISWLIVPVRAPRSSQKLSFHSISFMFLLFPLCFSTCVESILWRYDISAHSHVQPFAISPLMVDIALVLVRWYSSWLDMMFGQNIPRMRLKKKSSLMLMDVVTFTILHCKEVLLGHCSWRSWV